MSKPQYPRLGNYTRYGSTVATGYGSQSAAAAAPVGSDGALNAALGGAIGSTARCKELVIDQWFPLDNPLILGPSAKLRFDGGGLYMRNGANCMALRNANWISSYHGGSPVYTGAGILDTDIEITGRGTIVGNRGNGTVGNCTSGDPRYSAGNATAGVSAGQWINPVTLFGVAGLVMQGVTILDPNSFGWMLSNVFHARALDLSCLDPVSYAGGQPGFGRNTDSFHMVGPIDDLRLVGFTGSANDDTVGVNASDGNQSSTLSPDNGQGPEIFGGFAACYGGPITRVAIRDLMITNSLNGVRLLPGLFRIDQVTIEGVKGSTYLDSIIATQFADAGFGGTLGSVVVRDWQATQPGGSAQFSFGVQPDTLILEVLRAGSLAATPHAQTGISVAGTSLYSFSF